MCKRKQWFQAGSLLVLTVLFIGWGEQVQSQEKYPTRAINMICPFTPGGSADMSGRLTASYLSKKWGVPMNVVNKPGGNTIPAALEVFNATPDGYTMYVESIASSTVLEIAVKDLPFKVMDRTFISVLCNNTSSPLAVPANSPYSCK